MPKFPKSFGRRKSTANALEDVAAAPVEHSFKVFERPESGSNKSFDGGAKLGKPAAISGRTPLSHSDDDNMFENIGSNRGSGASNTNTASTTDNSSRLSAASTAPSSADMHGREDWKSPHDKPFNDVPVPPVPKSSSTFSLKNAGRTLSWGRNKPAPHLPPKESPSPTIEGVQSGRSRAVTSSSYASTATPPKLDDRDLGLSLGGDFSDMFSSFGKRKSVVMDTEVSRTMSQSPDVLPAGPANRSYTSNRLNPPSALAIDRNREVEASPYSWSSQHSREGLMSSTSPPPITSRDQTPTPPPPVPQHGRTYTDSPNSFARQRPGGLANTGLRRSSAVMEPKRQSTLEYGDSVDEDARLLRESINASRQLNDPGNRARDSWLLPSTSSSYKVDESAYTSWRTPSTETTPRAKKPEVKSDEDNLFDTQIAAAANVANRYQTRSWNAPKKNVSPQNKVMTPAQFERYKQDQERLKSVGGMSAKEKEDDDEEEAYDDDDDEAEKAKQAAKQRRKQEAHMAVYRQQMMKVTGETPSASTSRPSVFATQSSPDLAISGRSSEDAEEEDEEVPLAILQAHGFPSKNRPPIRNSGSNPNLRSSAGSIAGGVIGNGGNLPVFARNLPQDPYFGSSVVNPMHRESLSFGGGAGSVTGSPSRGLPPGGLVGVIATEERSRAMRRGSPNIQGDYGPAQLPAMNAMGMHPQMPQMGGSMYNGMNPGMQMGPMGQMNPMMLTPGDQAQMQMTQQMQQFMQMQMQFMQMMTGGQQPNGHMPHASMGDMQRPGSAQQLRPGPVQHQRAMTMLEPNAAPWMQNQGGSLYAPSIHVQGNGYAPSIAPSERSNVGLPGRYRPVSHVPVNNENSQRTTTMSGALQDWESKNASATIKPIRKSANVSDEDDEEGWEEMKKKREKKKSVWRIKKDKDSNAGIREMLNFAS